MEKSAKEGKVNEENKKMRRKASVRMIINAIKTTKVATLICCRCKIPLIIGGIKTGIQAESVAIQMGWGEDEYGRAVCGDCLKESEVRRDEMQNLSRVFL
jgi:hypothetical protein